MEWLLPYKLETDEARIGGHRKACPQTGESDPERHVPHSTEQGAGPWARFDAAMVAFRRSSQCSRS
jgi:hypothetical protein